MIGGRKHHHVIFVFEKLLKQFSHGARQGAAVSQVAVGGRRRFDVDAGMGAEPPQ